MLVARAFWHVLEHRQAILDGAFAVRRHLLPARQDVVANMVALLLRKAAPDVRALLHFLPLRRAEALPPIVIVEDALLILRRNILEPVRRSIGGGRTIGVGVSTTRAIPIRILSAAAGAVGTIAAVILPTLA